MKDYYYELVNFWVERLIGNTSLYEIKVSQNKKEYLIEVFIKSEFMGKVIGKNGKIITSIRNLVSSVQKDKSENVTIKILEKV